MLLLVHVQNTDESPQVKLYKGIAYDDDNVDDEHNDDD